MRYIGIFFLVFMAHQVAHAQYGIRYGYTQNKYDRWLQISEEEDFKYISNHHEVGLNYWFRLKDYRMEFLPEVFYAPKSSVTYPSSVIGTDYEDEMSYVGIRLNTQFYLFDFKEDCDCPTFSKQGPSLVKGFFVYLAPGMLYSMKYYSINDASASNLLFTLDGGIGYDFGLSDIITITPMAGIGLQFNDEIVNDITEAKSITNDTWNDVTLSIRLSIRLDYLNTPKWRR